MQQASASAFGVVVVWALFVFADQTLIAQDPSVQLRVDIEGAGSGSLRDGAVPWRLTLSSVENTQDVKATVVLSQRLGHCTNDPKACDGSENVRLSNAHPIGYGCIDGADNNGNGLIDAEDPDCLGITAWTVAVATDDCFSIVGATTEKTVADPHDEPFGLRDGAASFEKTELANPIRNAGQEGAVSSVVLSFVDALVLPQNSEHVVLRIAGKVDVSSLTQEGNSTTPCGLRIRSNDNPLAGSNIPVGTSVCLGQRMLEPMISGAVVTIERPGSGRFIRGDCDSDGEVAGITDAIVLLGFNFLGTDQPPCLAACDVNADGNVRGTIDDAIFLLNFFFQGGRTPEAPFPDCGPAQPADLVVGCDQTPPACGG
jgi:hypothetical protein